MEFNGCLTLHGAGDCKYGFAYRKDSKLLIANSNVFNDENFEEYNDFFATPELYLWKEIKFVKL